MRENFINLFQLLIADRKLLLFLKEGQCLVQEDSQILPEKKISCQAFAGFNLYCVRSVNGNMKDVRHWRHLRVKWFLFSIDVMIAISNRNRRRWGLKPPYPQQNVKR